MKIQNLFLALAIIIVVSGCFGDEYDGDIDNHLDDDEYSFTIQAEKMTSELARLSYVQLGTVLPGSDWTSFTLKFNGKENGGTYHTTNVPTGFETVWPSTGTWYFAGTANSTHIVRDGDLALTVTVNVAVTQMRVVFTIDSEAEQTLEINGLWTFVMDL